MKTPERRKITGGLSHMGHSKTADLDSDPLVHFKMQFLCNDIKTPHKNNTGWI